VINRTVRSHAIVDIYLHASIGACTTTRDKNQDYRIL